MEEWHALRAQLRCREDVSRLAKEQPQYGYETLLGIYTQLCQRQMISMFYLVKVHGNHFLQRYKDGQSLIDIADWINLSPLMVARKVLELHLAVQRKQITQMLQNPSLIQNERLRTEVQLCIDVDEHSGPRIDRTRDVIGLEYEQRLLDEVRNLGLEYESEEDLRKRECFKTPDVLLRVPVAFQGKVVCWIDSKAKFADEYTLTKDYNDSVASYVGRFGPGMVVYWFGVIEDCESPMIRDAGVLVVDDFPRAVETLPGTCLSR